MLKIIFILLFLNNLLFSNEDINNTAVHKKMSLAEAIPLFEYIKESEIIIGTGPDDIYVFIDPICPHSRAFISLIHDSENMQKKYKYHIWLYRLPKFQSTPYIYTIYNKNGSDRLALLYDIMVKESKILPEKPKNIDIINNYKKIESIAIQMDIYKRPYLFVNKKN